MNIYEEGDLEPITGETLRPGGLELTDEALAFCNFPPGAALLDIGCGTGATVCYLIEQCGLNAVGIDPSAKMILKGKKGFPGLPLFIGSGDNIPIPGDTMDGVLMECSFSLIKDPEFALTEIYRVLKKNGRLIISDFYYRNRPGVWTKKIIMQMLEEQDYILELWRDQSPYLGQLVADCIMRGCRTDTLWRCLLSKEENRGLTREQLKAFKPGYFLLIARKGDGRDECQIEPCSHDHGECAGRSPEEEG